MSEPMVRFFVILSHTFFESLLILLVIVGVSTYLLNRILMRARINDSGFAPPISGALGVLLYTPFTLNFILFALSLLHIGCAALMARKSECSSHLKVLAQAELMYAEDYDQRFPAASHWAEAIESRMRKAITPETRGDPFRCPSAESPGSYAMNRNLDGVPIPKLETPSTTVLLFDADAPIRSFAGDARDLARHRHGSNPNAAFADGHTRVVNRYFEPQTNWTPAEFIGPKPIEETAKSR